MASLPVDLEDLIVCSKCDLLHRKATLSVAARAKCARCGTVLLVSRPRAIGQVLALALTAAVLMTVVVFTPFLQLQSGQFVSRASVFDTVMTFSEGIMLPLSFAVAVSIVVLPLTRLLALIYAFLPLFFGRSALPYAKVSFALAERLRPWAMAEIFMVGVAVALVKLSSLATLSVGPAFWSFAAIVLVVALKDTLMCRYSLWSLLDRAGA
ncbi:paraquat-inducible protein A [Litoreibacter roseus]|uniref:Paraquat-inducible protein A n=1 Tax=Litoreibacter roseus TaxID=2601869 RepID=A0A6N6JI95_9RHOB|nr:paraquat-inducible protein A [Litoreibacter roseus]GFE66071.1 hypothetical protein KIN_31450 [Litoreibacter roseus]